MVKKPQYKVIASDTAKRLLGMHIRFLAQVSIPAARRLQGAFTGEVRKLADNPTINPFLDEDYIPKNKYRKKLVAERYLVLYQVKGDIINVDFVVDCRQNYQFLLK